MTIRNHITLMFLLLGLLFVNAQEEVNGVSFKAKLSKNKLGINERLRVDFTMNKDGDNFVPPSFEGFKAVGPNISISNSYAYGKRTYSKTYSFFLTPTKRGNFTIGQAEIEVDGNIYKSIPVKVTVTAAVDKPKDPNDPDYIVSQNIHLVAEVSNGSPYLNESITVIYKLYVSPSTGVSNWRELDSPRYEDFWSQNIDIKGLKIENGTYKGEDYRYVVLRKTVLYPQKTGKLKIEPLALDVSVEVPTNRRDIFGGRLMKTVNRTVAAGSRTINVRSLPEQGRPLNFDGAVGDFNFEVRLNKQQLKATEALEATVEVAGKGNLKLFKLPKLTIPSSLEVYEPEHSERITTNLSGMQGKIVDRYTIVPQYQGKYPIPAISFSYFNPKTERYETITSSELVVDVTEGPINHNKVAATSGVSKQTVVSSESQFASFKTVTDFEPMNKESFFKSKGFWTSLLAPLLAIPLAIFVRRRNDERANDIIGNKRRLADRLAKKYLSEAKQNIGKKEPFFEALHRALHNYLKAKLRIETSEFSKSKIIQILEEKKVSKDAINGFISLLESCELARYTPSSDVAMQTDYEKATTVITSIDKQLR